MILRLKEFFAFFVVSLLLSIQNASAHSHTQAHVHVDSFPIFNLEYVVPAIGFLFLCYGYYLKKGEK